MYDALPTLSRGAHAAGSGQACAMEYLSVIAGEEWSDRPRCTRRELRLVTQQINDALDNAHRHLLVPLLCRLLGANVGDGDPEHPVTRALHVYVTTPYVAYSPEDAVLYLSRLIDVYDKMAGRTETPVITEEQMEHALRVRDGRREVVAA